MTLPTRALGSTDIMVSCLGLGTVKFGRNEEVKYPTNFALPTDIEIQRLLGTARDEGINLLRGRNLTQSRDQAGALIREHTKA